MCVMPSCAVDIFVNLFANNLIFSFGIDFTGSDGVFRYNLNLTARTQTSFNRIYI